MNINKGIKILIIAALCFSYSICFTSCKRNETDSVSEIKNSETLNSFPGTVISNIDLEYQTNASSGNLTGKQESVPNVSNPSNSALEQISDITAAINQNISALDNTKKGWGQGTQTDSDNRPVACMEAQSKYGEFGGLFIAENKPVIYLTFDEGYENGYTAQILNVLKDKGVCAVFFVTMPYAKSNPDLIERMINEGHIVGNHSVKHKSMPSLSVDESIDEIKILHDYIWDEYGYTMTLFRPPMGEFSERSMAVAKELGYKTVLWSFAYKDWEVDNQPDESESLKKLVNTAHNGEILLLHAVSATNTNILSDFIDEIINLGFSFGRLE